MCSIFFAATDGQSLHIVIENLKRLQYIVYVFCSLKLNFFKPQREVPEPFQAIRMTNIINDCGLFPGAVLLPGFWTDRFFAGLVSAVPLESLSAVEG